MCFYKCHVWSWRPCKGRYLCSHFTDKDTAARRDEMTGPQAPLAKGRGRNQSLKARTIKAQGRIWISVPQTQQSSHHFGALGKDLKSKATPECIMQFISWDCFYYFCRGESFINLNKMLYSILIIGEINEIRNSVLAICNRRNVKF